MPTIEHNPAQSTQPSAARGHVRNVRLTAAQVLALNATPVALVPAPGASYALVLESVTIHKPAGTAYGGIAAGEDISVRYTDGSGTELAQIETTGFLDQATAQTRTAYPYRAASAISSQTPVANAAIVAHMLVGEITTGNSPLDFEVRYRVVPASAFAA
jgi:hypothetical protein